jgi:CelD/BcsL family acetyltransferase involved in cellulose biosynthesis
VTQKLLEGRDQWDCIYICNAAGWTKAHYSLSVVWKETGFHLHERVREFSRIELPDTYEDFLRLLSRNSREQIRRKSRRLEEASSVELLRCDRQDQLSEYLSNLFTLHQKRWESVGEAGSFARKPAMRRFYEAFAPIALRKGWLRLYGLKIDGVVAAVQYGYAYGGVFSQLQEGFDPDAFGGVGNILRNRIIKACIDEHLNEYDFLGGFARHKRRWGAKVRNGYDLFVGRNSFKNRLLFWRNISPRGRLISQGRPAGD